MLFFTGFREKKKNGVLVSGPLLLGALGLVCFISDSAFLLRLYPALVNAVLLGAFGFTLFHPPEMAFRFAVLQDKSIRGSLAEKRIAAYCRRVTQVWCAFFLLNGLAALYTVFFASAAVWSVYNGGVSYALIGLLFAGEYMVRRIRDTQMPKAFPLSQFTAASRPPDTVLCYSGTWRAGVYKTWRDFLEDTARLRACIAADGSAKWLLHVEDCWYFLAAFTALLQCKKQVLLSANVSPAYVAEIREQGVAFLSDQVFPPEHRGGDVLHVPTLLGAPFDAAAADMDAIPPIDAGETVILLYTSGTTGSPKVVRQRLTEFELDNRFILSKWGEEFLGRKLCSTVSQHHIYGLLFSILLPFTAGVPFRRERILYPESFETLVDDSYMIITVPAFLKRSVEAVPGRLPLRDPWIFTSGGVLTPEVAQRTEAVFGFWPVEVYGSTETSGIAYRQSRDGLEWTPFDNAEIRLNGEGCLLIRSPYIRNHGSPDAGEFATGDLADILPDGRFILKGRADSLVKIEEKRISLPEMESRILQSGLVADVCVLALEDRRQYLAAALALNDAGRAAFQGREKHDINRFFTHYLSHFFEHTVLPKKWRYLDALPLDAQGKKKKLEIEALFKRRHGVPAETVLGSAGSSVVIELSIPPQSDYFDGHFPQIQVMPAVAQLDQVIRLANRHVGCGVTVEKIKRIKFSNLIRPGSRLRVELHYNSPSGTLSFKISGPGGEPAYSSGTLRMASPSAGQG